ncbi:MAG: type II toxin-antitoxin system RelE/ParE family toxin [Sphingomonas sp.]
MTHEVQFGEAAAADLIALHRWIEDGAGMAIADAYLERLHARCLSLSAFPNRGTPRDDLGGGLRSLSFERSLVIFYRVERSSVTILRVVSGARELGGLLS